MADSEDIRTINANLGERIQALRNEQGLSQDCLALMVGLDRSNLSKIENGSGNPSFTTLVKLSLGLGVTLSELMSGIDPRPPKNEVSYMFVKMP